MVGVLALSSGALRAQLVTPSSVTTGNSEDKVVSLEEFKVQDSLEGQARAIEGTKKASNLVNIISADKMGTFPDLNAAEALRRLPGVSVVLSGGEGRFVSIRGARPQYNGTLVNGFSLPSGDSDTRRNDLVTVSNALIDTIVLTKTNTPDMPADGIGGQTNILMRNPLDLKSRQGSLSAYIGHNENGGHSQDREDVSYGDFIDKKHNYAFTVAANHRLTNFFFTEYTVNQPSTVAGSGGSSVVLMPGFRYQLTEKKQSNKGYDISFAAKIGDSTKIVLRDFKSDAYQNQYVHRWTYNAFSPYAVGGVVQDLTPTGGLINGRLTRLWRSRAWWLTIQGFQLTGTTDLKGVATLDYGYQNARSNERYENDFYANAAAASTVDPIRIQIGPDVIRLNGTSDTSTAVLLDPSRQRIASTVNAPLRNDNEKEKTPYINVRRSFNVGNGGSLELKSGGYFQLKHKVNPNTTYVQSTLASSTLTFADLGSAGYYSNFDDKGIVLGVRPNPVIGRAIVANNPNSFGPLTVSTLPGDPNMYDVHEDIYAYYFMGTYTWKKLTLIGGARYEETDEEYTRLTTTTGGFYKKFSGKYDNFLPSAHLKYELRRDLFLRASYSNTVARPNPSDIYGVESRDDINFTINSPNPGLKALESQNYDASLDWYSGPLGQFMVGAFQKDIKNFPLSIVDTVPINGNTYTRTSVQARADGEIYGFEVSFRRNLDFLPGLFSGLGVDINYAGIDSELRAPSRLDNPALPDQPKHVFNASLYYAYKQFFFRVAMSEEGKMIRSVAAVPALDEIRDVYRTWDMTANYQFGRDNAYQVFVEWRNLTNEADSSRYAASGLLTTRTHSGSNIGGGVRLHF